MKYTFDEENAIRTILKSDNSMEIMGDLLDAYAQMGSANTAFLMRKIPDIASYETDRLGKKNKLLKAFVTHTGNLFNGETLSDRISLLLDCNRYDMCIYMSEVANFKELYEQYQRDPVHHIMVTASEFTHCNPIAEKYIRSFVDLIDRLDDTGSNFMELVGPAVPDSINGMYDLAMWCKANLPIWYDLDEGKPKKGLKVRVKRTKVGKVKKDKYNAFHQKHGRK
jgi:hypothetical protein